MLWMYARRLSLFFHLTRSGLYNPSSEELFRAFLQILQKAMGDMDFKKQSIFVILPEALWLKQKRTCS